MKRVRHRIYVVTLFKNGQVRYKSSSNYLLWQTWPIKKSKRFCRFASLSTYNYTACFEKARQLTHISTPLLVLALGPPDFHVRSVSDVSGVMP